MTQAGAHPNLNASFTLAASAEPETAKSVRLGLPEGVFINPDAAPKCAASSFAAFECPAATRSA